MFNVVPSSLAVSDGHVAGVALLSLPELALLHAARTSDATAMAAAPILFRIRISSKSGSAGRSHAVVRGTLYEAVGVAVVGPASADRRACLPCSTVTGLVSPLASPPWPRTVQRHRR